MRIHDGRHYNGISIIFKVDTNIQVSTQLFTDLVDEEKFFEDVLKIYNINIPYSQEKEREILYDIISASDLYVKMRELDSLITLTDFTENLGITQQQAVAFVALCTKAIKDGKPLVDIRYHYFLKALDGCYLALDYVNSLSLVRKDYYKEDYGNEPKMFEIAVCEDCGEIAIVGNVVNDKLVRAAGSTETSSHFNESNCYMKKTNEGDEKSKKKKKI